MNVQLRTPIFRSAEMVGMGGSRAAGSHPNRYRLGSPGRCPKHPTLLICVFDDSGSVISPIGADPVSNRYEEARRAFQHIAGACTCGKERAAIVHFDTPTRGDVSPIPLRTGMARLKRGLRVPRDAAGQSILGHAIAAATRIAGSFPDHDATLVVFSDFAVFDAEPDRVFERLASFPGDVHAIALSNSIPAALLEPTIKVTQVSVGDAPGAVAKALFGSLSTHRRSWPFIGTST